MLWEWIGRNNDLVQIKGVRKALKRRGHLNWGFRGEFAKMNRGICKQRYNNTKVCGVTEPDVVDQMV